MGRSERRSRVARALKRHPVAANAALGGAALAGVALLAYGLNPKPSAYATLGGVGASSVSASPRDVGALLGAAATNVADGAADLAARAPGLSRRAPEVDARVAEQIVRRWQSAKAQALGVAHNLRPLEQVLEGPMLQQWLTRAEDVKAHGWAWEYQLNALTVDKVEVMTPSRVMVEATLTEVAVLKDRARTEDDDRYESTYRARYELRKSSDGGGVRAWKIVGGSVVY